MLVEEDEHFHLAGGEPGCDLVRHAATESTAVAHAVEQTPRDRTGQRGLAHCYPAQEGRNPLRRLALEEVAGGARPDRREQIVLRPRGRQDDHLARGSGVADQRQRRRPAQTGHREIEEHQIRLEPPGEVDRLLAVPCLADHVEAVLAKKRRQGLARQRVIVDDEDALVHVSLIGSPRRADKGNMDAKRPDAFRSWLVGELLLVALLGAATALFVTATDLDDSYQLPQARLVLDTAVAVVATIVAILTAIRFRVDGRLMDLLLAGGFWAIGLGTFVFNVAPVLNGGSLEAPEAWAGVTADILAAALIATAPFVHRRLHDRGPALVISVVAVTAALAVPWTILASVAAPVPLAGPGDGRGLLITLSLALLALLGLVALVGFGLRFRRYGADLDRWLAIALTLTLFAELHYVLTPTLSGQYVLQGDFLRLFSYGVLLLGVWRAISEAEFGRAVADERARVAREIHDGLAQYLFALSTHVSMLEVGAPLDDVLPRLKNASQAAQQEARFAVLALSSAGGRAPFDAALRRYVDFLTADGVLEVGVDIDPSVRLAPDEQIEIFRIVQEGLANARRHAGASRADVRVRQRNGRRVVSVRDNGVGFVEADPAAGQGLRNMRLRAESIDGGFTLRSTHGHGTAIEIVLRAA
jgi:signal transduction histidine kinase